MGDFEQFEVGLALGGIMLNDGLVMGERFFETSTAAIVPGHVIGQWWLAKGL